MVLLPRFTVMLTRRIWIGSACSVMMAVLSASAQAADPRIVPETKLRVSVIQWMPTKGIYEQWTALGGEFVVNQDGAIELPVVGSVPVGELDCAGLASAIADRLQSKIGLVAKPETIVEVVEYPPIYVVGDVTSPGEYRFRTGLSALQALALGGGIFRSPASESNSANEIRLAGELRGVATDIVRSKVRIARLEAEMSGATEFLPPAGTPGGDGGAAAEIVAQERIIFLARAKELERQTKSLTDLRGLLNAEIDVLQEKIKTADARIASAEEELVGISDLVEKGIAVASRKTDLEHALAGYRTGRLDQVTAVMRARQGVTEATRNMEGLRDKHQTEVAAELQRGRAELDQLVLKEEVSRKLLYDALGSAAEPQDVSGDQAVTYTIVRREAGQPQEIAALESTSLIPGDVVKVKVSAAPQQSVSAPVSFGSISTAASETTSP
jgi:protein involved in polysaccharide export with SLBB domain